MKKLLTLICLCFSFLVEAQTVTSVKNISYFQADVEINPNQTWEQLATQIHGELSPMELERACQELKQINQIWLLKLTTVKRVRLRKELALTIARKEILQRSWEEIDYLKTTLMMIPNDSEVGFKYIKISNGK